jgi:hypothetical protein
MPGETQKARENTLRFPSLRSWIPVQIRDSIARGCVLVWSEKISPSET